MTVDTPAATGLLRARCRPTLGLADGSRVSVQARWLAVLWGAAALVGITTLVWPFWSATHPHADALIGAATMPLAVALWVLHRRIGARTLHALVVVGIGAISVSVWGSGPNASSMMSAAFYAFVGTYAAVFFDRRTMAGYLGLIAVAYAAALAPNWRVEMFSQFVMTMVAVIVPAVIISNLCAQLRDLALRDPLTGLPNRRLLAEMLPTRVTLAERSDEPLVVVAIDLDGLKTVNDLGGHAAGDRLLVHVAQRWSQNLRASDVLARIGGDEFVLVLSGSTLMQAEMLIERLRAAAPEAAFSAGLASWSGEHPDDLLRRADVAMYGAKAGGPNRTAVAQLP